MKKHPRYDDAEFLRLQFPYQVEIEDWAARRITRKSAYLSNLHREYNSPASWADHEGARTFGFDGEDTAQRFLNEQGGTRLWRTFGEYVDQKLIDDMMVADFPKLIRGT